MTVRVVQKNKGWLKSLKKSYGQKKELAMGYPAGSDAASAQYPDGAELLTVAATNHYGSISKGIPSRPFMTLGAEPAVKAAEPIQKRLIPKLNEGKITKEEILKIIGPVAQAEFQKTIIDISDPPNAQSTIDKKDSSNPLVGENSYLHDLFTWAVRDEE